MYYVVLYGSEPVSILMILIGGLALAANVSCLYLMRDHKESGAHMKASYIFSANDVIVNLGVIIAGYWLQSQALVILIS